LKAGYLADIVLLSEDIFKVPPEKLKDVTPIFTMMDGKMVYEA
jgi:predicted amidohydrolase YtcJ